MNIHQIASAAASIALVCVGCLEPRAAKPVLSASDPDISAARVPHSTTASAAGTLAQPPANEPDALYPGRLFIGARLGVSAGTGEPANDIPTYGVYGRYRVRGPWLIGLAVDQASFDFENPASQLGIPVASVVDASIDATILSMWGEYEIRFTDERVDRIRPFVGAGLGMGFLSDDKVTGPTQSGGTFDIDVSGGTEIVPGAVGGLRLELLRNVTLEAGVRFDYHFTQLEVHDNIGGGAAVVDDYPTYGVYAGLLIRL